MQVENKSGEHQQLYVKVVSLVLLMGLVVTIQFLAPDFFPQIWRLATNGNLDEILEFLRSYGAWAIVVSFLLDILVNAVGFLPSIFISTANGLLFGLPVGIIVSWLAESVGVILSFLLMRYFFRGSAEKLIIKSNNLAKLDEMSGNSGWQAMALARTLPYFPSGILTALGAVSKMSVRDYVLATFIGKFPSTALEVIVGHDAVNYQTHLHRLAVFATLIAVTYCYIIWRKQQKKQ
ncbi:MAG: TVP38/TMEM64 family protein [Acidaminococcaceae bacterium]